MTSDSYKRSKSWKGTIWVTATCCLIAFIAYSSQLYVILPAYPRGIKETRTWLVIFNIVVALIFANYASAMRDPGGVPKGWAPPRELEKDQDVEARYCRACDAYKPPRAHHCRQCHRCILRMDHHCPWVNQCIGHHNYAAFLRFLFFVDVGIVMHLYKISECAFGRAVYSMQPTTQFMVMLVLNYAASLPVLLIVGIFSIYHLYCLLCNATTIEGFEREKAERLYRRGHIRDRVVYPFHLGISGNLRAVFGGSLFAWLLPWHTSPGDGLVYAVASGLGARVPMSTFANSRQRTEPLQQYNWPPKDPFRARPSPRSMPQNGIEHLACPPFAQDYDIGRALIDEDDEDGMPLRQRRGSEGLEIRPFSSAEREQLILADRYKRYDPNDENESSDDE